MLICRIIFMIYVQKNEERDQERKFSPFETDL